MALILLPKWDPTDINLHQDYIECIESLLDDQCYDVQNDRIEFARSHTWENSIKAIWQAIIQKNNSYSAHLSP